MTGELPLEGMKLPQLKEELAARSAPRVGLKAVLQRPPRLHGLLVQAAVEARESEREDDEMDDAPDPPVEAVEGAEAASARARRAAQDEWMYVLFGTDSEASDDESAR